MRRLRLHLPPELRAFEGHFEGAPILAGVVQLDWAMRFAGERFALRPQVERIEALKFFEVIPAGAEVELELSYDAGAARLQFSYTSGDRRLLLRAHPAADGAMTIRPCIVVPVYDHGAGAATLLERLAPQRPAGLPGQRRQRARLRGAAARARRAPRPAPCCSSTRRTAARAAPC